MDIVAPDGMQWRRGPEHRSGGVMFKDLFEGGPGPGNYWLTLVHVDEYSAPTHRHNFDQVRFMLDGQFGFGEQVQPPGSVGYFTAGLPYTQQSMGPCVHLLLQCEGADADPYISADQLSAAVTALKETGRFENGHYIDGSGSGVRKDGFEASWEYTIGRPVSYPKPRYERPLIMQPEVFAFRPDPDQPGVQWKRLGVFTERGIEISFLKIESGASAVIEAAGSPVLFYVLAGAGVLPVGKGDALQDAREDAPLRRWAKGEALRLSPGETGRLACTDEATLFVLRLPS